MSVTINGTSGLVFNDASTQNTSPFTGGLGFRNRIINGDFRIHQRNAGASVTPVDSAVVYVIDRWATFASAASKVSYQQNAGSVTPPAGFTNYLGATSLSAYSVPSGELFQLQQRIEGFNTADLGWGTANAQSVTLSFLVRSSLTGTFGGSLRNSAANRSYPFSYTISAANTWEQKSITIVGDTSGTWLTNNGVGIAVTWGLGVGSTFSGTAGSWSGSNLASATGATSVVGTNGATFYITGVQLEKGSTATSFDYRPYGTELDLCQRYAYGCTMTMGNTYSSSNSYGHAFKFPTTMRSTPSLASGATFTVNSGSAGTPTILVTTGAPASPDGVFLYNSASNWTVGAIASFTGVFTSEL